MKILYEDRIKEFGVTVTDNMADSFVILPDTKIKLDITTQGETKYCLNIDGVNVEQSSCVKKGVIEGQVRAIKALQCFLLYRDCFDVERYS